MGLFETSNPIEAEIEKATSENNTVEKWGLIMDICDKIGASPVAAKDSLKMIVKRLNHPDPHVGMHAITLLDACVKNCGKNYHLEIASRDFEAEFKKLLQKAEPKLSNKLKQTLKKWAEEDFKSDPQLNLIPTLYNNLKKEGMDFSDSQTTHKREIVLSKDPNVVNSQQEEDDIAKAIELSLKEKSGSPKASTTSFYSSSLYPNMNSLPTTTTGTSAPNSASAPAPEPRKVRALYDFEAAEENELTFKAGEIIMVLEDTDANWWRGQNQRGEGFFPSNFVSADLSAEPENLSKDKSSVSTKKTVLFAEDQQKQEQQQQQPIEVNEDSIDRLLFLLHEADPSDPSQDSEEMLRLEHVVNQMAPLIDSELERVDRKHAQLTQLSSDLIDTINLYHSLMRDSEMAPGPGYMQGGFQGQQSMYGGPGAGMYQNNHYRMAGGNMPPNMIPPGMMGPQIGRMEYPPSSLGYQMPQQPSQQQLQQQHMTNGHNQHPHSQGVPQQIHQQQQPIVNPNNPQINMMPQQQQIVNMPPMQGMPIQGTQSQLQMHPTLGQNFPPNHQQQQQQQPVLPQQHIGLPPQQQNFPMNPSMSAPNMHPQHSHQQMQQMMGNMNLQSPPVSMQNLHQMPGPMPNQINQPMTYLHQTDSNQNIPIYQQQR
ncbi:unnamed protein product [Diamesa serratosioi]